MLNSIKLYKICVKLCKSIQNMCKSVRKCVNFKKLRVNCCWLHRKAAHFCPNLKLIKIGTNLVRISRPKFHRPGRFWAEIHFYSIRRLSSTFFVFVWKSKFSRLTEKQLTLQKKSKYLSKLGQILHLFCFVCFYFDSGKKKSFDDCAKSPKYL